MDEVTSRQPANGHPWLLGLRKVPSCRVPFQFVPSAALYFTVSQISSVYFTRRWCLDSAIPWHPSKVIWDTWKRAGLHNHLPDYHADFLAVLSTPNDSKCLCLGLWTVPRVSSPQRGKRFPEQIRQPGSWIAGWTVLTPGDERQNVLRRLLPTFSVLGSAPDTLPSVRSTLKWLFGHSKHKWVHVSTFIITTSNKIFLITENIQRPTWSVKTQSKRWACEHFDTKRNLL